MNLYNLRLIGPNKFQMAKFDSDFNVEAVYDLEPKGHSYTCNCPANARTVVTKPCRHKRMMPFLLGAVNTDRFFDPDTGGWCQPFPAEPPDASEASEGQEPIIGNPLIAAQTNHLLETMPMVEPPKASQPSAGIRRR